MVINLSNMTQNSTKHVSNDIIYPQARASAFQQAQPHYVSLGFLMFFSSAYFRQFIRRYFLASFHSNKYITSLVHFYTVHHHLLPYAALTHMNHIANLCYPCETYSDYVKLYLTWCLHTHCCCTFIYLMESRINTAVLLLELSPAMHQHMFDHILINGPSEYQWYAFIVHKYASHCTLHGSSLGSSISGTDTYIMNYVLSHSPLATIPSQSQLYSLPKCTV
jgi:hypothetical protein